MSALFHDFAGFVADHRGWAGLVLGVATFLESLVLIGAFIPATALMLAAGGLIATGALDAISVLAWSVTGAALGDAVSYAVGTRLGRKVLQGRLFRRHRRAIARTRLFARRYGVGSVFLGRFFGPLRAFVPVMAGMIGMKAYTFQLANFGSALVWVAALVSPGYLAGLGAAGLAVPDWILPTAIAMAGAGLAVAVIVIARRRQTLAKPAQTTSLSLSDCVGCAA